MKTSIIAAATVLSLGAISPALAQSPRVERVTPAYSTQSTDRVETGRSAYVDGAAVVRPTPHVYTNTVGRNFYGQ